MRARRSSLDELIQIDGSAHDWFEGRGLKCCLLVFIDGATSRIMMMHFEEHESTQGYFDATKNYIKAANAFLPQFIKKHNKQFAVAPASEKNMHRENKFSDEQLNLILTHQDQRKASKNLELSYENIIYQIQSNNPSYAMRGAMIKIYNDHGKINLSYKGQMLAYKTFDKKNRPTPVVTSKELNKEITLFKPKADHPWRRYPDREVASPGR